MTVSDQRTSASAFPAEAAAAIARGELVSAIKIVREATGLDLRSAKDLVDAYRPGQPLAPPRAGLPMQADDGDGVLDEVRRLVAQGRKLEAIKLMREAQGLGLAEAKDAVEQLEQPAYSRTQADPLRSSAQPATAATGARPPTVVDARSRSGTGWWLLLAAILIGAALWYAFLR